MQYSNWHSITKSRKVKINISVKFTIKFSLLKRHNDIVLCYLLGITESDFDQLINKVALPGIWEDILVHISQAGSWGLCCKEQKWLLKRFWQTGKLSLCLLLWLYSLLVGQVGLSSQRTCPYQTVAQDHAREELSEINDKIQDEFNNKIQDEKNQTRMLFLFCKLRQGSKHRLHFLQSGQLNLRSIWRSPGTNSPFVLRTLPS